jgi:hypothetical protein
MFYCYSAFLNKADQTPHLALSLANRAAVLVKLKFFKEAAQAELLLLD